MALTLFAPGTRKGNRYWLVRGLHDGRRYEMSTKTADKAAARQFLRELERELAAGRLPKAGDVVSFAAAAELYCAWANPGKGDRVRIARIEAEIGRRAIADLRQADLVAAANRLFPDHSPATKNRWVIKPAAAILHYAARQGLCGWLRIEKFREARPQTRAVSLDLAGQLVAAAPAGPRRLVLVWLFRMGTRISDTLQVRWDAIDLQRQTVRLRIGKADNWTELPLHPELVELLAAIPHAERADNPGGRLFPWTQKSGVYRWLRPLVREMGVAFTPHMARHSLGTWLNEGGAGLRTIMGALHHRDPQSSIRYQMADVEIIRAATAQLPALPKARANG